MPCLAFYRGRRTLSDRVICAVTRSPYSHVEFLPDVGAAQFHQPCKMHAISSSGRDGGVRSKDIEFDPNRWDILGVPWAPDDAADKIISHLGKPYDYPGLIGSQLLNLRRQSDSRWFCSEICAYALGMGVPHKYAPGDLHRAVLERNAIYAKGLAECLNTEHS